MRITPNSRTNVLGLHHKVGKTCEDYTEQLDKRVRKHPRCQQPLQSGIQLILAVKKNRVGTDLSNVTVCTHPPSVTVCTHPPTHTLTFTLTHTLH